MIISILSNNGDINFLAADSDNTIGSSVVLEIFKAGLPALDHTTFLQDEIFNKRPEQLSVAEFISLTNRVSAFNIEH